MLLKSDDVLAWIEDLREAKNREMERASRRGDPSTALLAVGGKDALGEIRNRVTSFVDRETYESIRAAAKAAKKIRPIDRSKSA